MTVRGTHLSLAFCSIRLVRADRELRSSHAQTINAYTGTMARAIGPTNHHAAVTERTITANRTPIVIREGPVASMRQAYGPSCVTGVSLGVEGGQTARS